MRRAHPESTLQRHLRRWLALRGFIAVHVPNGASLAGDARQRAIQMANLKRDGLVPGFPDLLVYGREGRMAHVEVKAEGGRQQDTQRECQQWLEGHGQRYAIWRSIDDAEASLRSWGWIV